MASLRGEWTGLAGYQGSPVILIFFDSQNEQAGKYLAEVSRFHDIYGGRGLLILGITAETDTAQVNAFAIKNRVDFPLLTGGREVLHRYEVGGVPDTYCVTKYGMVCERLDGCSPEMEAILETVIKLMVMKIENNPPGRGN